MPAVRITSNPLGSAARAVGAGGSLATTALAQLKERGSVMHAEGEGDCDGRGIDSVSHPYPSIRHKWEHFG